MQQLAKSYLNQTAFSEAFFGIWLAAGLVKVII